MRRLVPFISAAAIVGIVSAVAYAFTGAAQFDPNAACLGNAKLLVKAIQQYELDNDEHLPPTNTAAAFHAALLPYVSSSSVFVCPETHADYQPNQAISGESIAAVSDIHSTVLFQDTVQHTDGKTTVAYVDGSVLYDGKEVGDVNQICVDRAHDLAIGVEQYVQDYDETFPPMNTQAAFEAAVSPYVRNPRDFICPATNKLFVPNPNLSNVPLNSIVDSQTTVLFSDPDAHPDGIKTVAYADGHIVHGNYRPGGRGPATPFNACGSNVRQIALALTQYIQDNDETFPAYKSYAQFVAQLMPYAKKAAIFKCPDTGLNYVLNPALNGVNLAYVNDPASVWYLRDAAPNSDGSIHILWADGHTRFQFGTIPIAISMLPTNEAKLLWYAGDGRTVLSTIDAAGAFEKSVTVKQDLTPIAGMTTDTKLRTLILRSSGNTDTLQFFDSKGTLIKSQVNGPYDGWDPIGIGIGPNWQGHLLWKKYDGTASVWTLRTDGPYMADVKQGPISGLNAISLASAPDNSQRLLWIADNGIPQVEVLDGGGNVLSSRAISPMPGWTLKSIAVGSDNVARVMWTSAKHSMRIWKVPAAGVVDRTVYIQAGGDWQPVGFGVGADGNYRALFAGAAGALVDVVSPNGTVISSNVLPRP